MSRRRLSFRLFGQGLTMIDAEQSERLERSEWLNVSEKPNTLSSFATWNCFKSVDKAWKSPSRPGSIGTAFAAISSWRSLWSGNLPASGKHVWDDQYDERGHCWAVIAALDIVDDQLTSRCAAGMAVL